MKLILDLNKNLPELDLNAHRPEGLTFVKKQGDFGAKIIDFKFANDVTCSKYCVKMLDGLYIGWGNEQGIEGFGRLIYFDGRIYEGFWSKFKYNGKGRLTVPQNTEKDEGNRDSQSNTKTTTYEGNFKNGLKHGHFTIIGENDFEVLRYYVDGI